MTEKQMKLALTRIGEHSTTVFDGDLDQIDIPGKSGLLDALERLEGMPGLGVARFTEEDSVRSPLVKEILRRYKSTDKARG